MNQSCTQTCDDMSSIVNPLINTCCYQTTDCDLMDGMLNRIRIEGFKSIRMCDIELGSMNVLIGSNGSGKSNLLSVFSMLRHIIDGELSLYAGENGNNSLFFNGLKTTGNIDVRLTFGANGYGFSLRPSNDGGLMFNDEFFSYSTTDSSLGRGHRESKWHEGARNGIDPYVKPMFENHAWRIYHFHDTSHNARVKQWSSLGNNRSLAEDAGNLAAFLYMLRHKHEDRYNRIVDSIRLVAPYFDDFVLRPNPLNEENIRLEWKTVGNDEPFNVHQLSDGTLRFICLATLLLQPSSLQPSTIVIDEPELGLHPAAISILAEMLTEVTERPTSGKQIIISTQSVELLDCFKMEDIIVADREGGESVFRRLDPESFKVWIEDYTLGDLWKKNILGGRP